MSTPWASKHMHARMSAVSLTPPRCAVLCAQTLDFSESSLSQSRDDKTCKTRQAVVYRTWIYHEICVPSPRPSIHFRKHPLSRSNSDPNTILLHTSKIIDEDPRLRHEFRLLRLRRKLKLLLPRAHIKERLCIRAATSINQQPNNTA